MKRTQYIFIALCLYTFIQTSFSDWMDITPSGLKNTVGDTMGVTFGDVDGDGDDDLLVATGAMVGGKTLLYLNDGLGNFTNATTGIFSEYHNVWSPLLGDSDNDGDADLFFVDFGEQCRLYENLGSANFIELDNGGMFSKAGNMMARGGAWVDFDADGLLDIYVSTNAVKADVGRDKLYRNMGNNTFEDVSPDIFNDLSIGRGVAWCDFDDDGDLDLYAVGGKGCPCNWEEQPAAWLINAENRMFRNDGGVFTNVTDDLLLDALHGRGVTAGDYDNDGDLDLYICNVGVTGWEGDYPETYLGYNRLLRNEGNFQFTDVTPTILRLSGGERSCSWFDNDNDGDLDLLMTTMWTTAPAFSYYENVNAGESFTLHASEDVMQDPLYINNSGTGSAISDIDDDGDLDLMLAYKFGPNQLLRNDIENGYHWIKIKLEGTVSNRDAIGARITVKSGVLNQIREIQTGSGYWSQHSLVQHFGMGELSQIDEIHIRWPSGIEQIIASPDVDQLIYIVESEALCEEDLTNDGTVNIHDLLTLVNQWGECEGCAADFDGDGVVSVQDIIRLISAWGDC